MRKITFRARGLGRAMFEVLRRRAGQLAYYGGVALALTAIAYAAESYRAAPEADSAMPALPAVELALPAEEEGEDEALHAPENAEPLRAYSSKPEWNAALRLWESHEAVDYRLDGDAVESLSSGLVRTVGRSGVYGGFVEVECGEFLLRYASIAPREGIQPGDKIDIGDSIGTADESMPGETDLGAHLHLELLRDGKCEDFVALTIGD